METIEAESSWVECLSEGHAQYIFEYIARAETIESAVIDQFLKDK